MTARLNFFDKTVPTYLDLLSLLVAEPQQPFLPPQRLQCTGETK